MSSVLVFVSMVKFYPPSNHEEVLVHIFIIEFLCNKIAFVS